MKPGGAWSNSGSEPDDGLTLIDELLGEQRTLTAVERFARAHDGHALPALEKHYRRLLPATAPAPGQQYAFEVDLDKCSGCKACVTACHSLNGLDENETWRSVGMLVSDSRAAEKFEKEKRRRGAEEKLPFVPLLSFPSASRPTYQQHITTACHHCVDPGCLNGCPVLAYDKDPLTGIVRHLDDQCIGCQYCVMKCPYEVPQYSKARGIVRKCDMCSSRLAVGEAPACVQACPNEAIKITLVDQAKVRGKYRIPNEEFQMTSGDSARPSFSIRHSTFVIANEFLPASPNPAITLPTTRYLSQRPLPATLLAGDHTRVTPSESHLPLVFMLVLTQLSVGASVAAVFIEPARWLALVAVVIGAVALGIASLHLGKPLKAWRAFLGWRKSWFSREVIVFGGYVPLAATSAAAFWFAPLAALQKPLAIAAAATGLLGVMCSAMIYVDTRREFWRASQSFGKFLGTTLLLGAATTLAMFPDHFPAPMLATLLFVTTFAKLTFEHRIFRHLVDEETPAPTTLNKSARLIEGQLGLIARGRVACAVLGGLVLPPLLVLNGSRFAPAMLTLCLAGELLERYLFFTAVAPAKMPGGFAA